ncbi:hypothetical protein [Hyalangium versicolor]|uniref:hypothetical protein n=1 Tax=Hyalangium versicolor TaxID=2861190 RepID=UPI001CCFD17C|nr:hypothetical protein [Hyalangium versicolor]
MRHPRLFYTRAARRRLQGLPAEVRLHLENHLENLALLVKASPPERLPQFLARVEEGFVTAVKGVRVLFVVDATARTLLIHRIEVLPGDRPEPAPPAP